MGDFVKGRLSKQAQLSPTLLAGIRLHRMIDSYTDRHPQFRQSRARLAPPLRRYGGIIIDIFYDHYLALYWRRYSDVELAAFCASVYATLQSYYHAMPAPMQRSVRHMIAHDWLGSYRDIDGVARALDGIERRLRRPCEQKLHLACHDLARYHDAFGDDFTRFFADLRHYAEEQKRAAGHAPDGR